MTPELNIYLGQFLVAVTVLLGIWAKAWREKIARQAEAEKLAKEVATSQKKISDDLAATKEKIAGDLKVAGEKLTDDFHTADKKLDHITMLTNSTLTEAKEKIERLEKLVLELVAEKKSAAIVLKPDEPKASL